MVLVQSIMDQTISDSLDFDFSPLQGLNSWAGLNIARCQFIIGNKFITGQCS